MKSTSIKNATKGDKMTINNCQNIKELKEEAPNINIIEPRKRFIILNNSIYENNKLTALEIAILIKGLTSAPNYKITREKLIKRFKVSASTLETTLKSLKKQGYLMIERNGKKGSKWTFSQYPILNISSENEEQNELFLKIMDNIHLINFQSLKTLYNAEKLTSGQVNKIISKLIELSNINWIDEETQPNQNQLFKNIESDQLIKQMKNKSKKIKNENELKEAIKIANIDWLDD